MRATVNGSVDDGRTFAAGPLPTGGGGRCRRRPRGEHRDAADDARLGRHRCAGDRVRAAGGRPRETPGPAARLPLLDRHARRGHEAGDGSADPAEPRRHRGVRPCGGRHRAGQQPRDPRAVRHRSRRAPPGRADLRPGRGGRLHDRRGRPRRSSGRGTGRHRGHPHQLRGRPDPLEHLADVRGGRLPRRCGRLHQGPRLRLRGRSVRPGRQPRSAADQGVGPVRARSRRRGPAHAARST